MGDFSATEAIGSGFRLIGRNPAALLWWALVYGLIGVLPQVLALGLWLPDLLDLTRQAGRHAAAGAAAKSELAPLMVLQSRMLMLQPILIVTSLVSQAVVVGAIYRGVLTPQDRRFGYVRFGGGELWLGLVTAVFVVLVVIAVLALSIPVGIGAAAAAMASRTGSGMGAGGGLVALLALLGAGVIIWVVLRLSLGFPMSFAQRNFRLFESWSLTRGHAWKLFGVSLAAAASVLLIELLAVAAAMGLGAIGAMSGQRESLVGASSQALTQIFLPWLVLWIGLGSIVAVAAMAIMAAPWAEIYRQLSGEAAPAERL